MSNVNKTQLSKDIKRGSKVLKWITDLADELDTIGSIEQANTDAMAKLELTNLELNGVDKQLSDTKIELVRATEELEEARAEAKTTIDDSKNSADNLLNEARNHAANIRQKSDDMEEASEHRIAKANQVLDEQKNLSDIYLAEINAQIDASKEEHDKLLNKIVETKKEAYSMVRDAALQSISNIDLG